jgi:predicted kinase
MAKIKIYRGLPGSGKSTAAKSQVVNTGNGARINRDDLRAMLFDSVWTGKREGVVIEVEKAIAQVLLKNNMLPFIDDCNITEKHQQMWLQFALENGVDLETTRMDTPLKECIHRDSLRPKPVGEAVINRMALNAGLIDFGDKPIILCDLDGTLCDEEHRRYHLNGEKKSWNDYFSLLSDDKPVDFVIKWVRELAKDHTIALVSGRPDTYQFETLTWLRKHEVPFDYIFMRPGSDKRSDVEIKTDILNKIPKHLIDFCLDDRPVVIREVWRKNGVKVYPVQGGCKEF